MLADPSRRAGLRKDRAQLAALVDEPRPACRLAHLAVLADFHPELTLVSFLEDDAKTGGEFRVRSTAARAAVVAGNAKT
jgi:hypothetical protein